MLLLPNVQKSALLCADNIQFTELLLTSVSTADTGEVQDKFPTEILEYILSDPYVYTPRLILTLILDSFYFLRILRCGAKQQPPKTKCIPHILDYKLLAP